MTAAMSKRFTLVLSEIGQAGTAQRARSSGAFSPVVVPPVAAVGNGLRNGGNVTRRCTACPIPDLEAGAGPEINGTVQQATHQHHVVALDVPSLPRRAGLRNCLFCGVCMWIWIVTVTLFVAAVWRPEFAVAMQVSRRIAFAQQPAPPPRVPNEHNHCTFSVIATVGKPSRLQLIVSLASVLSPSVDEDDVALEQLSPGFFEVNVACCTRDVYQTLKSAHTIESWNVALGSHYEATVAVSRPVEIERPLLPANLSLVKRRAG